MNKSTIKNYAIWARTNLISAVKQRAYEFEITKDSITAANAEVVSGKPLSKDEKEQRRQLIDQIYLKGFDQVMEEVAYTWFNRFIALRFMEVNGYLPTKVRLFTDGEGHFKPEILKEALSVDLPVDKSKVMELLEKQDNEELYKMLLIAQCNDLSSGLPDMFEVISDYTELLFPNNLLKDDSVLGQMVDAIPENDWTDAVQIIGWLYQYYNSELKDETFSLLKKNVKISKENIPAATQLFTPDWIVRYMVENSLGRLWYEGHPNEEIKKNWKYYLDEAEQEPEVEEGLKKIRDEYKTIKPEDIKVIDPCMGSGHILVYAFDVLMQIYTSTGWSERDAAESILENNLYGLDIDDRAGQLAYFAVMMKARKYSRRILTKNIRPKVFSIQESNSIKINAWWRLGAEEDIARRLIRDLTDAKEYGSILNLSVTIEDLKALKNRLDDIDRMSDMGNLLDMAQSDEITRQLYPLVELAEVMVQQYDVVVTNPPYMGGTGMDAKLIEYVFENYPDSKYDLFSVCMDKFLRITLPRGFTAMVTMESWMFLASFERFRKSIISQHTIKNLVHMPYLGKGGTSMGISFGTSATVFANAHSNNYKSQYVCIRYYETDDDGVPFHFPTKNERFCKARSSIFFDIPGSPIAYWASENVCNDFRIGKPLESYAEPRQGVKTLDNDRFLRLWFEVPYSTIEFHAKNQDDATQSKKRWFPYNKGGEYRRWYGNNYYVVNWENDGYEMKQFAISKYGCVTRTITNIPYFYKPGLTWSALTTSSFSIRWFDEGYIFDSKGSSMFFNDEDERAYVIGFMNSKVASHFLEILAPTLDFNVGPMKKIPIIYDRTKLEEIKRIVMSNISIAKEDWDLLENSWDFGKCMLLNGCNSIREAYELVLSECKNRYNNLRKNEERINSIFIGIYGLEKELSQCLSDNEIKIRIPTESDAVKSLVSYAVGCMFGRYSLDEDGLVCAGCEIDPDKYHRYHPDKDGILPICDDEYFEDDIVSFFVSFIKTAFGTDNLEDNLNFIANALGGKGTSREVIRSYFLNGFYSDHLKQYQKRPIYWLFDSGKKNGFKCLIYIHRYQQDTVARIRTDYIHEMQSRYRTAIDDIEKQLNSTSGNEYAKLTKRLNKLKDQELELNQYEEKIHHIADQMISIDLNDGVRFNYEKFEDVLARLK